LTLLSYRNAFFAVSAALVASLAMRVARPPAPVQAPHVDASSDPATCTTELAACRAESWNIIARTIRADVEERHAAPADARVQQPAQVADTTDPTGAVAQEQTRCEVAEQQAREHWLRERANILASVKDIGKPAWVAKELDETVSSFAVAARDRDRLAREYAALWSKYGSLFQNALSKEPADWALLIDIVRAFFHDEDALIERTLGPAALAERRASELRSRTTIMAIIATLAEKPFDDSLVW
jgi:hypothetical protein